MLAQVPIHRFQEVDSTQDVARELLSQTTPPFAVIASVQKSGRGRRDRVWHSPEGGLYLTVVHRAFVTPRGREELHGFWPLAAGVAVRRVLRRFGYAPKLKWPNDLVSDRGGKLGGILVHRIARMHGESEAPSSLGEVLFLTGVGVNIRPLSLGDESPYLIESLAELSPDKVERWDEERVSDLGRTMVEELVSLCSQLGCDALRCKVHAEWGEVAWGIGSDVRVLLEGAPYAEGTFVGVRETGEAMLRCSDGQIKLCAIGELSLRLRC